MKKKATMRDVAAAAGVSVMSVSYALRHHPSIPEATAERLRKLAGEMGYVPNPLVSALFGELRSRRKSVAPPLVAYLSFYAERSRWWNSYGILRSYYEGARQRCEELGFAMEVFEPNAQRMSPKRLYDILSYRNVVGVIVGVGPASMPYAFAWDRFPCVSIGYTEQVPPVHRVMLNHFQTMDETLRRVAAMGYQRIALGLLSRWRLTDNYLMALHLFQRDLPASRRIAPFYVSRYTFNGKVFGKKIAKAQPDLFIDAAGQGRFMRALQQIGVGFPRDMGYVTFNWHDRLEGLAGVNQNSDRIGATAVDLLVNQINFKESGIPDIQKFTLVSGSWVDGASAPGKVSG
ncbi:MAG TPA: LacI family DNA-binding transcriptional regulator [Chthoniobacteraceae bacterium]|nr:LacI family DNA-binding transcriptional regulator [Chthoniobacteraceae bacterium]